MRIALSQRRATAAVVTLVIGLSAARVIAKTPDVPTVEYSGAIFIAQPDVTPDKAVVTAIEARFNGLPVFTEFPKDKPAKLPILVLMNPRRARFLKGLAPNERLMIKGPIATTRGTNEWMWIEVRKWPEGGPVQGLLMNDPADVPALKVGAPVSVKQDDVFDYIWYDGEKIIDCGETVRILEKRDAR
jgi:hypothetical protein